MKQYQVVNFGRSHEGKEVKRYTLENDLGDKASFTEYGAALVSLQMVDEQNIPRDIVLGYDTLTEYESNGGNLGATCGRFANRIKRGEFRLGDQFYTIPKNNGNNVCHSGVKGFHTRVWTCLDVSDDHITFQYVSADKEMGFPGEMTARITYTFDDDRQLTLDYEAESDQDTVVNLTNHSYFNLQSRGSIADQLVEVNAHFITPVDEELIPTGEIKSVAGTGFDLRKATRLADVLASEDEAIQRVGGLDHNFVVDAEERGELRYCARLIDRKSGMQLVCYTTEQGVQVYTANSLKEYNGSGDRVFGKHMGICFETQNFPDSPNICHFPSPVLRTGETYTSQTIYAYVPYTDL